MTKIPPCFSDGGASKMQWDGIKICYHHGNGNALGFMRALQHALVAAEAAYGTARPHAAFPGTFTSTWHDE